jgi:ketosteroid isomerase-like protein
MKSAVVTILIAAGGLIAARPVGKPVQAEIAENLTSLINAERAFSRASETTGIREAFLTWLAPDALVFRPAPVAGRPVYEKMDPASPTVLTWEPEVAEIAASGELGYTSGPYRIRTERGAKPTVFGHYVSVWKKQTDGTWRVFLDVGIQHGPPSSSAPVAKVTTPRAGAVFEPLSPEAYRDELGIVGKRAGGFESMVNSRGSRSAYREFATDDIRIYRPGRFPSVGKALIKKLVPRSAGGAHPRANKRRGNYQVLVAWSADLACAYGTSMYLEKQSPIETTAYLRIWRKESSGVWKISLDIELPVPEASHKKD